MPQKNSALCDYESSARATLLPVYVYLHHAALFLEAASLSEWGRDHGRLPLIPGVAWRGLANFKQIRTHPGIGPASSESSKAFEGSTLQQRWAPPIAAGAGQAPSALGDNSKRDLTWTLQLRAVTAKVGGKPGARTWKEKGRARGRLPCLNDTGLAQSREPRPTQEV